MVGVVVVATSNEVLGSSSSGTSLLLHPRPKIRNRLPWLQSLRRSLRTCARNSDTRNFNIQSWVGKISRNQKKKKEKFFFIKSFV
jgi:hypothetical protein